MPKAIPKIVTTCEVCGTVFERPAAFHRSAESKGGKVRFCGMKCFGEVRRSGLIPAFRKTGKAALTCEMCGNPFEVWPSRQRWTEVAGSKVRFCSQACHGAARTARLILLPSHPKEASVKKSVSNRASWGLPPHDPEVMKLSKSNRARLARGIGFNNSQLKNWLANACAKCGATDRLQLDHIVCMAAGGKSVRENAQTLCRPCHRWKVVHEDKPLIRQQSLSGGHEVRYNL